MIKIFPYNIFDLSTVTTDRTGDTGYNLERIFDGSKAFFWKWTGTNTFYFEVDQGSDILDIDGLFIWGHNWSGEQVYWQYDDSGWTNVTGHAGGWAQSDNLMIAKIATSTQTWQKFRVYVTSMDNPECSEVWMSKGYSFVDLEDPRSSQAEISNVIRSESIGGLSRRVKMGDPRRSWSVDLRLKDATDRANFEEVIEYIGGTHKPFVFEDVDDNYWLMELSDDPMLDRAILDRGYVSLNMLEVL